MFYDLRHSVTRSTGRAPGANREPSPPTSFKACRRSRNGAARCGELSRFGSRLVNAASASISGVSGACSRLGVSAPARQPRCPFSTATTPLSAPRNSPLHPRTRKERSAFPNGVRSRPHKHDSPGSIATPCPRDSSRFSAVTTWPGSRSRRLLCGLRNDAGAT